jgi:KDO2-lipid IV(A) lauroyltransferase
MKNYLEYFIFNSLCKIFCHFGIYKARKFSNILAFIFYYIVRIRKAVVFKNLRLAFPNLSDKEIKKIAYENYKSITITLIEILCIPSMSEEEMKNILRFDQVNLFLEKYNLGRGLILMSGHFGNWEFTAISGSLQMGIPFQVLVKPQRNTLVDEWMNKARTRWNNKVIPLGVSIRSAYQVIKEKKIIAMVADQRGPNIGIRVNMFGIPSAIYTGPAVLALKNNTPILVGVSVRQKDYSYVMEADELSLDNLIGSEEDKIKEICQRYTDILEKYIRRYPEQWLWMHNRWRH